jgi:indolepyruvate ferredoxin oxidoreductase alpha subunit
VCRWSLKAGLIEYQVHEEDMSAEPKRKPKQDYVMGNAAITRGAVEAGVRVATGYPGTPATEILEEFVEYPHVAAQWSANEKVALETALGASLTGTRAMAVMKHNGTNVATDFIMHLNFTGVAGGLVLISADDPGGLSSQNEEDSRILVHTYANLPVFDPSSAGEAKAMVKDAYELSEKTQMCFVLRPVMRICHSRAVIDFEDYDPASIPKASWKDDRDRYIMSGVEVRELGGIKRPQVRHRWLNEKYIELAALFEDSPYNHIEEGQGSLGLIGCGIGYTYLKEAEALLGHHFPTLKLCTLPLPEKMVLSFLGDKQTVIVFEEIEPVVQNLIKQLCQDHGLPVKVLGRSGFYPQDGELTIPMILEALKKAQPGLTMKQEIEACRVDLEIPIRTRTQCVGCAYRGLLHVLKRVARRKKGVVFGDIGCHDAGAFKPLELQSTIYCMGSSIPMATGAYFAGLKRPLFAMIGDSTFFHLGLNGLINAAWQGADLVVILCDNGVTAMTGFQPHPGSGMNVYDQPAPQVDLEKLGQAIGVTVRRVNPYDLKETRQALIAASEEKGVSLVISSAPCHLRASRRGEALFEPRPVRVVAEDCNGCRICITEFGCPALVFDMNREKVSIDELSCVKCGLCAEVCPQEAIR